VDKSRDGTPIPTAVVTLLVTPPDAERLALATTQGQIVLSLRNPLDTAATESAGARMGNLTGAPNAPPVMTNTGGRPRAVVAPPPPPPPAPATVTVQKGNTVTTQIIKGGGDKGGGDR